MTTWPTSTDATAWRDWMNVATADDLRALCAWGSRVLAATEPIGPPDHSVALPTPTPPPAPLTPRERARLRDIQAQRRATNKSTSGWRPHAGAAALAVVRRARVVTGYVPTDAELVRMRRSLRLSQRAAAALVPMTRSVLSGLELGTTKAPATRAVLWRVYERRAAEGTA